MTEIELLTQEDLAERLKVTKGTLREWRRLNKGPDFVRIGKAVFYRPKDVLEYLEHNTVAVKRTMAA